jgi:hypothetical protein
MHLVKGHHCCLNFLASPIRREEKFGPKSKLAIFEQKCKLSKRTNRQISLALFLSIPTRGNLFLPVRLLVWVDGRGTVAQADSAARAELQEAQKQKLPQLKNIQKYNRVKHREMLICCFGVSPDMKLLCL